MSPVDLGPHVSLERMNRFQEPEARRIIGELGLPSGSRGLDVGCGVGLYALWLAEAVGQGGRVVGIEPEPAMRRRHARWLAAKPRAAPRVPAGDGTAIPLPDRSVDWVWCGDVLHHIVDTEKALREFPRVVRPGGRIIVKESQVFSAMCLPGHPELERRIQLAEIRRTLDEGAGRSFQERRQTTPASLRAAGLASLAMRTYTLERARRWAGPITLHPAHRVLAQLGRSAAELLSADDWRERSRLCDEAPRPTCRAALTTTASTHHGLRPAGPSVSGLAPDAGARPAATASGLVARSRRAQDVTCPGALRMSTPALARFGRAAARRGSDRARPDSSRARRPWR